MATTSSFSIPLTRSGDDGAGLRLLNRTINGVPERQRQAISQDDKSGLTAHVDLFSVSHGKFTPDGDRATLIITDFRFVGNRPNGQRFRQATIVIMFEHDENEDESDEPCVAQIAPEGTVLLDPSVEKKETTATLDASLNGGFALASVGISAGFSTTSTVTKEHCVTLEGETRIEPIGKRYGPHNAAKWIIRENPLDKNGIPSFVRTAILVKPGTLGEYRAQVRVDVEAGLRHSWASLWGKEVIDPVYFADIGDQMPFGPQMEDISVENLSACNLNAIGKIRATKKE